MNSKLNIQELAEQIAKELNMGVEEINVFLDAMFLLINESLLRKEEVKIKSIGVFKLTLVDKRESVDVNTGERIEIPPHYKVVFAPDNQFKDAVNKPFSIFDTIDLSDDTNEVLLETHELELLDKIENDALLVHDKDNVSDADSELHKFEEKEQLGDDLLIVRSNSKTEYLVNAEDFAPSVLFAESCGDRSVSVEDNSSLPESYEPVGSEKSVINEDVKIKSSGGVNEIAEKKQDALSDPILEANEMPRLIHEAILAAKSEWSKDQCSEKQLLPCEVSKTINADEHTCNYPRSGSFSISLLILLAGFAMGGMCVYCYYLRQSVFENSLSINEGGSRGTVVSALVDEPALEIAKLSLIDTIIEVKEDTSKIHLMGVSTNIHPEVEHSQGELMDEKDLPLEVELKNGMRLVRLAEQYYGNKVFWVYIYEENKSVIKNPNILPVGVVIDIPPRSKYAIDKNDSVSLNNAKKLQAQLLGRFK